MTYAAGTIRPSNFTQAQQDQHVRNFYDYWKSNYLVAAGHNSAGKALYRIAFGKGSDVTVSEGQGFGMVTVALMAGYDANAQSLFDGLWYYARQYPSAMNRNLMSWKTQNGAMVGGNNSAFDGDIDIAYGLLLADAQWGSTGTVNYLAEAKKVIEAIKISTIGTTSYLPKLGDWTADISSPYNQYTPRSSDFMPAHFRSFYDATQNAAWLTVIQKSQNAIDSIQTHYSASTGLLPDFLTNCDKACQPAYAGFLEGGNDGAYYYNAGRTPWRLGLDALLNNDTKSKAQVLKMVRWLARNTANNASNIKAGYQLNGTPIGYYSTSFFIAPFGVGAMLEANQQSLLNSIYALVYNKRENYYEDSVNMLNLLIMTGNYWKPSTTPSKPACSDGFDNDQDGKIDYPQDLGCSSATDTDETDPIVQRILTVSKAGLGAGTISSTPAGINCGTDCTESYNQGTSVTLTATPALGSVLSVWSGACAGTAATCTVSMTAAKSVTASFAKASTQALTVTLTNTNDWGTGYCSDVKVYNPNSVAIDWKVTFSMTGKIYTYWNFIYTQVGQQITAEGVSWNNLVQPKQSVVVGFCANR
jgi:endo-1,4-beta-D-glucanase Y